MPLFLSPYRRPSGRQIDKLRWAACRQAKNCTSSRRIPTALTESRRYVVSMIESRACNHANCGYAKRKSAKGQKQSGLRRRLATLLTARKTSQRHNVCLCLKHEVKMQPTRCTGGVQLCARFGERVFLGSPDREAEKKIVIDV